MLSLWVPGGQGRAGPGAPPFFTALMGWLMHGTRHTRDAGVCVQYSVLELPRLPGGVDMGGLYELADLLADIELPLWVSYVGVPVFSLIGDGDHRLARPQDLARLIDAVQDLATYGEAGR